MRKSGKKRGQNTAKIKKAILKDIWGLIQLEKEAQEEFKEWNLTKREEFVDLIRKRLMYTAKVGNRIVGYINIKIIEGKTILDSIYVRKKFRKKGIGRELIDRALTDFKKKKFKDVIITSPPILRRFYERFKLNKEKM